MRPITKDAAERLSALLDSGLWKHTWHLKRRWGRTDWQDQSNLKKVLEIVKGMRNTANERQQEASELILRLLDAIAREET